MVHGSCLTDKDMEDCKGRGCKDDKCFKLASRLTNGNPKLVCAGCAPNHVPDEDIGKFGECKPAPKCD